MDCAGFSPHIWHNAPNLDIKLLRAINRFLQISIEKCPGSDFYGCAHDLLLNYYIRKNHGSVASVKKIPFYANDCEPIKNMLIENQCFMILDCPGFD